MADQQRAVASAALWWASLGGLASTVDGSDHEHWLATLVRRIWDGLDPITRHPMADRLAPGVALGGVPDEAELAHFVMVPGPLVPGSQLAARIAEITLEHFGPSIRRLERVGHERVVSIDAVAASLKRRGKLVPDPGRAVDLYDRLEVAFEGSEWSRWVQFPDDLTIVEFGHDEGARFLMARRGERWLVLLTPSSFVTFGHRGGGQDGGEMAGVREPRNPLAPSLIDRAANDEPT